MELKPDYKLTANYAQEQDCNKPVDEDPQSEDYNFLEMETDNGGGGTYYILRTKRWALDDPKEIFEIINDFIEKSKFVKDGDN